MQHKKDVPCEIHEVLIEFNRSLRLNGNARTEEKQSAYKLIAGKYGKRTADLAWAMYESNISSNQVSQYFNGATTLSQNANPGGTNVTQTAGGNMTGVNATGTQLNRDITVYSQDLDQSGATINAAVKSALVEARRSIESSEIDESMKPMIVEQFDKLTEELKKGDKKNPGVVSMLWTMVYGAVKAVPAAAAAIVSLDKLKGLIGL